MNIKSLKKALAESGGKAPYEYKAYIYDVYDGDGVYEAFVDMGLNIFSFQKIRLAGVDTPELKGYHKEAGRVVRDYVRSLILNQVVIIKTTKKGKYGRWLADVEVNGIDLAQVLIDNRLAKKYHGNKKEKWTQKQLDSIVANAPKLIPSGNVATGSLAG
jgi:endonuclease YncB( thermonuclease family)